MNPTKFSKTEIALAFSLIALRPAFAADPAAAKDFNAAANRATNAEAVTIDSKADLAEIDFRIDAIEEQLDRAPDEATRKEAAARLEQLKERRSELRKDYVQAKFEELKADVAREYARASVWVKESVATVKEKISGPQPGVGAEARALVNPKANRALADIEVYRLNPSAENKTDVKHALKALETEIDRLEERADAMPKGPDRDALKQRIKALEQRESDLSHDFTKARWDAMIADLRHEWNELFD